MIDTSCCDILLETRDFAEYHQISTCEVAPIFSDDFFYNDSPITVTHSPTASKVPRHFLAYRSDLPFESLYFITRIFFLPSSLPGPS
jgi:hypothetical protein